MSQNKIQGTDGAPVVLITGGTSGIGLATATLFAEQGYHVAICARNQERLTMAIEKISQASGGRGEVVGFQRDMADPQDAVSLHDAVLERFGTIDVLVNNASSAPQGSFETMSDKTFETMVNTNIRSVFYKFCVLTFFMRFGLVPNMDSLVALTLG